MNDNNERTVNDEESRARLLTALEDLRKQVYERLDKPLDQLIEQVRSGEELTFDEPEPLPRLRYLSGSLSEFKGKKPVSVTLPGGQVVETRTWKQLVTAILRDCNSDPQMHERLLELSGMVHGRDRILLAGDAERMDAPLKIDEGLYMEGKFDTESLLYVLTERILRPAGYNYRNVCIEYAERSQVIADPYAEPQEQTQPMQGMSMGQTMC